jgi:hypothetical protein
MGFNLTKTGVGAGLTLSGGVGRVLGVSFDPDALAYITAVETADGQQLESGVRVAIDQFVRGCKADGIWNAIKSSCILAGARTLSGALRPLVGTAPTNFNFVSADYNRKTGLVGNGTSKYLNSNRNNNADPQDDRHISIWVSTLGTDAPRIMIGCSNIAGRSAIVLAPPPNFNFFLSSQQFIASGFQSNNFTGCARNSGSSVSIRLGQTTLTGSSESATPANLNIGVFASEAVGAPTNARIAFYSIGEDLDLALLDSRVTALITAINGAIP